MTGSLVNAYRERLLKLVHFYLLAFTTTATESEAHHPARALSPLSPSSSFISKQLYMKPSHSEDLTGQIKAVVDTLLHTITVSSKRKYDTN
jgi:hypothetical protein